MDRTNHTSTRQAASLTGRVMATLTVAALSLAPTAPPTWAQSADSKAIAAVNKLLTKSYDCQSKANSLYAKTGDNTAYNAAGDKCDVTAAVAQAKLEAKYPAAAAYDTKQARRDAADAARRQLAIQQNEGRFAVPGDGTVIDLRYGLQWMKDPVPGTFTVGATTPPFLPDGTVYTSALSDLNGNLGDCFGKYCDWRLPTSQELATLLLDAPCAPTCLETAVFGSASAVWTATSDQYPEKNLLVDFVTGAVTSDARDAAHVVRAVRQAPLPQPLECGTSTKCVFLTSKVSTANLGGLAGADATCNQLAASAGLPGTYVAWLSDDLNDAVARVTSDGPYATRTGRLVAASLADLTDGGLESPISQDEYGNEVPLREAWTDSDATGLRTYANCNGWTSGDYLAPYAIVGWNTATDANWSAVFLQFCNRNISHYCIQQ